MKIYSLLIILSILMAFFSGRVAFMVKDGEKISKDDIALIQSFIQEMRERAGAVLHFDLQKAYPKQSYLELLTTQTHYTKTNTSPNSTSCLNAVRNNFSHQNLKKEDIWMSFRCRVTTELPDKFFEIPPYIHSSGYSYAYLAFKNLYNKRGKPGRFLPYFHASELNRIKVDLPPLQDLLAQMKIQNRLKLVNGNKFFTTSRFLFVNNGLLSYSVFNLRDINIFLKRNGYIMESIDKAQVCFFRVGSTCINEKKSSLANRFTQSTYFIFFVSVFLLIITAWNLFLRIKKQNNEDERKKHALRVLTHELRTPISSLILQIDNLSDHEGLPSELLDKLLRVESDVYRLKFLAEKSRDYLQADSDKLISFKPDQIGSINSFFEELLIERPEIELKLGLDTEAMIDQYWVQMCFMNLISNAEKYGKGLRKVEVNSTSKCIEVSVLDEGDLCAGSLKELLQRPRRESATGMGIGLEIVYRTLKEMGGSLSLQTNPTKFTMRIPRELKE